MAIMLFCRRRKAVRLNSGVRAHMRNQVALLIAVLLSSCAAAPSHNAVASDPACFWSTDGVRYNHFSLRLNPDHTYRLKLIGDIATWGESSGTWEQEGSTISLTQLSAFDEIKFPARLKMLRSGSLGFEYKGAYYSAGGTDMTPRKCEP